MRGLSAEKAYNPFKEVKFVPFRDASYGDCSYKCTVVRFLMQVLDCLRGLEYAIKLGWFDFKKFNLPEYEHFERVENGDLNWIIPNKFIAFSSPYDKATDKYGVILPSKCRINCVRQKIMFPFLRNLV